MHDVLYSIRWERLSYFTKSFNTIPVQITFLNENGLECQRTFEYEDWFGVCTSRIQKFVKTFRKHFPNHTLRYENLGLTQKVLPYFRKRLETGKLDYREKPFYKVYTSACHEDVGQFFNKYKIAYYDRSDWLTRIFIDLCMRYNTKAFYYAWYNVDKETKLIDALYPQSNRYDSPDWTIGAFDLETVPMDGAEDRVPTGLDPSDKIVMASVFRWNQRKGVQKFLLYLLPPGTEEEIPFPNSYGFKSENMLIRALLRLLDKCQVVTGYNIYKFDLICLFCRILFLNMFDLLVNFSSQRIGTQVVILYKKKLMIDLYKYFRTYSEYDLPGFKLDDVARVKLKDETKIPIKSQGIWCWYLRPNAHRWVLSDDRDACYNSLCPGKTTLNQFGTFKMYMEYCLRDSQLVYKLLQKENVLEFLVGRANFSSLPATHALLLGNSSFLLNVFKTYGTFLGFFINTHFMIGTEEKKYQGALNLGKIQKTYENVVVLDFVSMYPSTLLSANLCYGTCGIMTTQEFLASPTAQTLTTYPYRNHTNENYGRDEWGSDSPCFQYPKFDPMYDSQVVVVNQNTRAFLPCIVEHFIELRKMHQCKWKETKFIYHYNAQLCIKILINSLYGTMANKDSILAYLDIAKAIVCLCRNQILGSYHRCKNLNFTPCYIDTDSLMIPNWPWDHGNVINEWLNLPKIELKFEKRLKGLLILCKKKYIDETEKEGIVSNGLIKRFNPVNKFMLNIIIKSVWQSIFYDTKEKTEDKIKKGWKLLNDMLLEVIYMCRDPKKYSICRQIKNKEDYKSKSCTAMRLLEKYPNKNDDFIYFTFSRSDGAETEAGKWVMDADDCEWVNYEQFFRSQKKIFCDLLNMGFWNSPNAMKYFDLVFNSIHWRFFVHAELKFYFKTRKKFLLLIKRGVKYTFQINDHCIREEETLPKKRKHHTQKQPKIKKSKEEGK